MRELQKAFLSIQGKSNFTGMSLRMRLFLFLMMLVLTMSSGIIIILLVTGSFSAGLSESKHLIRNELMRDSNDISSHYGQISVQATQFSKELSSKIDTDLQKQSLSFRDLSDNPAKLEELISDLYETTYYSLQKFNCSGAFLILNATVNPTLNNSVNSKAGLYIKNMEPNVVSSSTPNFTLLRGFSSIGRKNSINLHTQWSMEFDVEDADYYRLPIEAVKDNRNLPLSKLYYWSYPLLLPGTSEEVMLCSIPIIDSNYNVYGVCGFEISSMLFKLTYMPQNNTYTRMLCMLSPYGNSSADITHSLFAGGYSMKDFARKCSSLKVKEKEHSYTTYSGNHFVYLGFHNRMQLYPKESPFSKDKWITAVLVPKDDIVNSITRFNFIIISLLSLLVFLGIIISIIFSKKYLKPISIGIEAIKSTNAEAVPKTNVQEIDDLISYLAEYKNELNKKAETDKYQISLLEQFVERSKTLTPAERSVFLLYANGLSAKEIAGEMYLSINTIKTHSKHIFAKLEVASREELLLYVNMLKEIGLEVK